MKAVFAILVCLLSFNAFSQIKDPYSKPNDKVHFTVFSTNFDKHAKLMINGFTGSELMTGSSYERVGYGIQFYQNGKFEANFIGSKYLRSFINEEVPFVYSLDFTYHLFQKSTPKEFELKLRTRVTGEFDNEHSPYRYEKVGISFDGVERKLYFGPQLSYGRSINFDNYSSLKHYFTEDLSFHKSEIDLQYHQIGLGAAVRWGTHILSQIEKKKKMPFRKMTFQSRVSFQMIYMTSPIISSMPDADVFNPDNPFSKIGFSLDFSQQRPFRTPFESGYFYNFNLYSGIDSKVHLTYKIGFYLGFF